MRYDFTDFDTGFLQKKRKINLNFFMFDVLFVGARIILDDCRSQTIPLDG